MAGVSLDWPLVAFAPQGKEFVFAQGSLLGLWGMYYTVYSVVCRRNQKRCNFFVTLGETPPLVRVPPASHGTLQILARVLKEMSERYGEDRPGTDERGEEKNHIWLRKKGQKKEENTGWCCMFIQRSLNHCVYTFFCTTLSLLISCFLQ